VLFAAVVLWVRVGPRDAAAAAGRASCAFVERASPPRGWARCSRPLQYTARPRVILGSFLDEVSLVDFLFCFPQLCPGRGYFLGRVMEVQVLLALLHLG